MRNGVNKIENIYAVDPYINEEFKTRLKVGEVVIVFYADYRLMYRRYYVSIVKDITIDKENHIYTCRLDNFNIDFNLCHQVPSQYKSADYSNIEETISSYVYKTEDFEKDINFKTCHKYYNDDTIASYKVLTEALKLQLELSAGGNYAR